MHNSQKTASVLSAGSESQLNGTGETFLGEEKVNTKKTEKPTQKEQVLIQVFIKKQISAFYLVYGK